jgi:hypothetical protein
MTKKELVEVIRTVVKSEVKKAVKKAINEIAQPKLEKPEQKTTLQEVLAQTEEQGDWKSMGEFNSQDARGKFAAMQGGNATNIIGAQSNLLSQPAVQNDESLQKAFTRDYSGLVKAMKKK